MNKLESLIANELEAIDVDSRYDDMLNECYPDLEIAGMSFQTSDALKELDPTAYRCGLADWISEENFVEINNEYYDGDKCDGIKDDLVSEIESQIEAIEEEISDEESNDEPCQETISELKVRLAEAETEREKWDNYSF